MTVVSGISIFEDRYLVGPANKINIINFKGTAITASASGNISTITATISALESASGQIVFIENGDFQTSQKLSFNPSVGILTTNNGINVGNFFNSTINGVGIGIDYPSPTNKLQVNGNALITDTIKSKNLFADTITINIAGASILQDSNGNTGNANQLLSSTGVGVSWIDPITDVSGTWGGLTGVRTDNVSYTNNTGSLLYVSATPGIARIAEGLTDLEAVGSYSIAEVDGIEVARTRDNGNQNSEILFLNVDFLVPIGSNYNVKVYTPQNTVWLSSITTYSWTELEF
jgi:hypothetical protein